MTKTPQTSRTRVPNPVSKEERAKDAALAMREYEAEQKALLERTAQLRALRLAHEAVAPKPDAASKPRKRTKKAG